MESEIVASNPELNFPITINEVESFVHIYTNTQMAIIY